MKLTCTLRQQLNVSHVGSFNRAPVSFRSPCDGVLAGDM
jgi:hypothetical protein